MTEKQLTEGQNLIDKIKKLEKRIEIWNKSTGIHQLVLSYPSERYSCQSETYEDYSVSAYIDFDVIKTLVLSNMNKRLNELKEQFQNL